MPHSAAYDAPQIAALALEQVGQAYVLLDGDFRYVLINREAERLALFDRASLIGRCMWEVFPDVLGTKFEREIRRVMTERIPANFENYSETLDRWFDVRADPMDGGLIVGFREITRDKALQAELEQTKDIIALVSESDLIGSFRWLIPEDEVIISPEMYELYGLERGSAKRGSSLWRTCLHPEDREMMASKLGACFAERITSIACDFRTCQPDGAWRWIHCRAKIRYDQHGKPLLMVGVNIDVTGRKELEEQLRRKIEELETVMEVAPVAIRVANDPECRNVVGNRAAKDIWDGAEGPRFFQDGVELATGQLPIQRGASENTIIRDVELTVLMPGGATRTLFAHASPLRDANGEVRGAVGAYVDITALKRTEKELIASEARYRHFIETCPVGLLIGTSTGEKRGALSVANDAYLRITGYSRAEFDAGKIRWDAVTAPEHLPITEAAISELNQTGFAHPFEKEYIRKDGTRVPVLVALAAIPESEETGAFVLDLTELRATQRKLEERSAELARRVEEFETLLSVAPVGIAVSHDAECRDIRVNPAFARMLGVNPDENSSLTGPGADRLPFRIRRDGQELSPQDMPQQVAARTGVPTGPAEFEVERADGERFWVVGAAAPLFENDGTVRGTIAAYFDATELRAADSKVRESHAQLRRLVDANIVGVGIANDRQILVANDLYLEMLGYTREDLEQGRVDWTKATAPESLERSLAAVQDLHNRGFCAPFEKEYSRPDGTRIPVLLGCVTLTSGPEPTWIFLAVDLSPQKNLERELHMANQRLTNSNDELQRFASIVTHDLRSPLRTVSMMTELLVKRLEGKLDSECLKIAEHIRTTVVRMSSLIADLLEYSMLPGDASLQIKSVDCVTLIELTIRNLQTQIEETGARITVDPLPMVRAGSQLIRVFQNLIDNALKYRSERPLEIHVSAQRSGNEWVFSVRDNGIGFDMQYAEQIFEPFQRLHGAGKYAGSGIGLATSRKLVERHGGEMWADSELGAGTVFYFKLPAAEV